MMEGSEVMRKFLEALDVVIDYLPYVVIGLCLISYVFKFCIDR